MKSRSRHRGGKRAYDDAPIGLALISSEGRFLQVNPKLCTLLGYTRRQLLRTTLAAVTDPHDLELMASSSRRLLAGEVDEFRLEQHFLRADGRPALGWISASVAGGSGDRSLACVLEMDEEGERGPARDRTDVVEIHSVLDDFFDGVVATDEHGRIASFNRGAQRLFGYQTGEVLGREAKLIIAEPYREEFASYLAGWMRPGRETAPTSGSREMWGRRKDGSTFPIEFRATRMLLGGEKLFVGILRDISEQKAQTEALEYQTLHDVLTSLPNRTLLNDRLHQAILSGSRQRKSAAVLVMDVDGFKEVNDTHGHHVGDQLLQNIALRLEGLLRGSDTVARLGGDEFAIVPAIGMGGEDGATTARKILRALEQPFLIDDRVVRIAASIGIAVYPADGLDAPTLMRHADAAMYVAKRARCGYAVYAARQDRPVAVHLPLARELGHAIAHDELVLHYQPKIDFRIGKTTGVEALVRWQHPKQGLVPANQFIPVAEETELIKPLTRWVLNRALQQSRIWLESGLDIDIAVNLSARNLQDPDLPATARGILEAWRVDPGKLKVDIPERSIMAAPVIETATHLGAMGIGLAIDDFGTGSASLAHLSRLPVREIKIDRSFIAENLGQGNDSALRRIVDRGHNMGLRVVAEGVEDQETLGRLVDLGCDAAQGFHVCPPIVAVDLVPWLRHSAWGVAARNPPLRVQ
ncbi:MAG TPA: EAL domain-containing protein [Candidatus Polarisedimenticolia bacterium]|nr:EAL domain-containing protein [Candidatus Polarisedimenticolia bacterium]